MLAEMRIQGLGVIDDATLALHAGLTVVTGETGAGKTMVVTGLHLLGGGRADASRVRSGAQRAVVEGRFQTTIDSPAAKVASDAGAEPDEDGSLIALRTVTADGRSRAHLGGRSVPNAVLSELAEQVLAVHGQNDQLRLLRSGEQRAVLDRFAGEPVLQVLANYQRVRAEWAEAVRELTERTERSRELAREADLLRHGLSEIEAVGPEPGEDVALVDEARRLADVDQLREIAAGAHHALTGAADGDPDAPGAIGLIGEARRRLSTAEDPALRELEPRVAEAVAVLADVGGELGGYLDRLDADPARLEQVLARQAELKMLTKKYAADVDGVLAWAEEARARLSGMDTSEEALAALAARRDELAAELAELAAELTEARREAAVGLSAAVSEELDGLAMAQARLEVVVQPKPADAGDPSALQVRGESVHAGPDGVDEVELQLIAHSGAPALPIHKGASGGELSRVMLALEVVLADADTVPTLVFDEVDAGVGGRAAVEIGRRLARLARTHQVVVVTHLPQVAAYADRHLVVDKGSSEGGLTRSDVRVVADERRVVELARMLAGMDSTETGRAHAEELLNTATAYKLAQARFSRRKKPAKKKEKSGA
ncbi:DNA repair protein RecN (Recombination protein N) [Saccharopolyspora antimicrobica]|uniref:DNA repair protein RecN n=1 Tax=Saccharopolyspora antimicrobica TaxID=455193 RepID=A0A1I5H579_9PSEU|nr:DNA repair protein RecN [Saccharopolyspora antimicrobica]RKT90148.1 DNA replication and repair protein RecN [Saccharopolyspora antimicrobica]SFO43412.1 DNA repair protein RecN (Recombination protein N) [Saccharopolyspora antimicrobica]